MEYLNLTLAVLRTPEYLGSDPIDRATWLNLSAYSATVESGGRIVACREWKDRRCQQILGITRAEMLRECDLWRWDGPDLIVAFYPLDQETKIATKRGIARLNGTLGGRPPKNPSETEIGFPEKPISVSISVPTSEPTPEPKSESVKEGKEKEGKGITTPHPGREEVPPAVLAQRLVDACPTPAHTGPALEAALDCLRRHPGRFDDILAGTAAATAAIRQWPEDERITYRPAAAKFFRDDLWLTPPDQWSSRREAKKRLTGRGHDSGPALTADQLREKLGGRVAGLTDQEILAL